MSGEDPQVGRPPYGPDTTMSFGAIEPVEIEASAPGRTDPGRGRRGARAAARRRRSWSCSAARAPAHGSCSTRSGPSRAGRRRADIFLDDVTVSRKHAEFVREGTTVRRCATSGR